MESSCPSCGGRLLSGLASPWMASACPACIASLLLGEPEPFPGEASTSPAAILGGYRLVREIARGGMGTVWLAERTADGARVALKLLPHALAADPARLARFRAEATLAARLAHPHIVAIRDIGEHDGTPFFTMDLVDGPDLGTVAGGLPMLPREAARLVRWVALAVHFAHEQGVLHRDIKPTNVLLGPDGQPRVTDFGLARLLDMDARLTATGETMGSPSFMAPEQVSGQPGASGVRTDVHGLGGLLYFCLTGRAPFAAESVPAALAKAMESRPVPPREWEPSVPPPLEAIALRCLARSPSDRYPGAAAVAEDLERALTGQPVQAAGGRTDGGRARWGWSGGAPWLAIALATSLPLAAGLAAWWSWSSGRHAAAEARRAGEEATVLARYAMDMGQASRAFAEGDGTGALRMLEAMIPPPGQPDPRGIEWFVLRRRVATLDGVVHAGPGPRPAEWTSWNGWPATSVVQRILFSGDGQWLVVGHEDGNATRTRAWRVDSPGDLPAVLPGLPVAVEPGGRALLLAISGGTLELRHLPDGILAAASPGAVEAGATGWQLSLDGAFVAGLGPDQQLRLVHVASGQPLPGPVARTRDFRLSPDGNGVLLATPSGAAWFTLRPRQESVLATGQVASLTLDAPGRTAAIGQGDGSVLVLDLKARRTAERWKGHEGRVTTLGFSPDGRTLMSGGADGWVRFWNTVLWREILGVRFPPPVEHVVASPDGQRMVVLAGGRLHLLDTTGGAPAGTGEAATVGFWSSPARTLEGWMNRGARPLPPEAMHY